MITVRQLRYFLALAGSGHFGRAAEQSGVTQPALSMQLRELEAELGSPLFERAAGGARLTALGEKVLARANGILAAIRDLEELGRVPQVPLSGRLRIGMIPSVAPYLLPRLLERAKVEHPSLQLMLRETVTENLVQELSEGSLDAIVASLPLEGGEFEEAPAFDDPFLLAAPAGAPLAAQTPALTELIDADELLLLEDGHCLRDQALAVCHRINPGRLRNFGATSLATVLQLVAAGQGVTLVPELAVDDGLLADPRLALVRFAAPEPHRTLGLAWRRNSPRRDDFQALTELIRAAGADKAPALAAMTG
jgi:LysR family transcriptional regulator, hydrogen peroxide-inducible genes activator